MGGAQGIIGGAGYCILTSITVVIFGAALFILTDWWRHPADHIMGRLRHHHWL
jgi:hypothetical protein